MADLHVGFARVSGCHLLNAGDLVGLTLLLLSPPSERSKQWRLWVHRVNNVKKLVTFHFILNLLYLC